MSLGSLTRKYNEFIKDLYSIKSKEVAAKFLKKIIDEYDCRIIKNKEEDFSNYSCILKIKNKKSNFKFIEIIKSNLYSKEFYEILSSKLSDEDGIDVVSMKSYFTTEDEDFYLLEIGYNMY